MYPFEDMESCHYAGEYQAQFVMLIEPDDPVMLLGSPVFVIFWRREQTKRFMIIQESTPEVTTI